MTEKQGNFFRTADALASAWERRTLLVKQELAAASAANDAKTARLKALRLERDRLQADASQSVGSDARTPNRKRVNRISA